MTIQTLRGVALAVWCFFFMRAVHGTTLAEFMGPYEPDLKYWALTFALLGGTLRSIRSWEGDERAVRTIAREFAWNLFHSAVSGFFAFILVQALRGSGWAIPQEVRVGCIMLAGWHGKTAIDWMWDFIKARIGAYASKQDGKL